MNRNDIKEHYKRLCNEANHPLTRSEYRKVNTLKEYSSSVIETIWGSWKAFMNDASSTINLNRYEISKVVKSDVTKAVITSVIDGSQVDVDCFETLVAFCNKQKCPLFVLWGKATKPNAHFSKEQFDLIKDYLVTNLTFVKDKQCKAADLLIPATAKNPLMNLDKLSKGLTSIIVGSPKQYLDTLPRDLNDDYKIAVSTGTISTPQYRSTISGLLDEQNHTLGALFLMWSPKEKRYNIRNLQYKDGYIYDLNECYSKDGLVKTGNTVECMVLGDLHAPETDEKALDKTIQLINYLEPKNVMLHDWISYQSINHHEEDKVLSKLINTTPDTIDLETELNVSLKILNDMANRCQKSTFNIVHSNHDEFLMKWLNTGEFAKGNPANRIIGCTLFANIANGLSVIPKHQLAKNVKMLKPDDSMRVKDFELAKHGDSGISGARGNINAFVKSYTKSITGHTHSPKIKESGVIVGTLSKLHLSYNKKSITNWAHANCVVHTNGTFQLIFV